MKILFSCQIGSLFQKSRKFLGALIAASCLHTTAGVSPTPFLLLINSIWCYQVNSNGNKKIKITPYCCYRVAVMKTIAFCSLIIPASRVRADAHRTGIQMIFRLLRSMYLHQRSQCMLTIKKIMTVGLSMSMTFNRITAQQLKISSAAMQNAVFLLQTQNTSYRPANSSSVDFVASHQQPSSTMRVLITCQVSYTVNENSRHFWSQSCVVPFRWPQTKPWANSMSFPCDEQKSHYISISSGSNTPNGFWGHMKLFVELRLMHCCMLVLDGRGHTIRWMWMPSFEMSEARSKRKRQHTNWFASKRAGKLKWHAQSTNVDARAPAAGLRLKWECAYQRSFSSPSNIFMWFLRYFRPLCIMMRVHDAAAEQLTSPYSVLCIFFFISPVMFDCRQSAGAAATACDLCWISVCASNVFYGFQCESQSFAQQW